MKRILVISLAAFCTITMALAQDQSLKERRLEEREAYAEAKRLNTVDAWEIFINNYPESFFIEQARKMRDAAIVNKYCNSSTTLEQLTTYIDEEPVQEPRIRMFYANLVNNPTHSYRFEHMDVGFNGCTGRVDEQITFADGSKPRHNYYIFNQQGLLTESAVMGSRGNVVTTTYGYAYDNLHGYTLKSSVRKGSAQVDYEAFFNSADKLDILTSDGSTHKKKWVYTYNDNGALTKLVVTDGDRRRVLVYNDGYIIREEADGKVFRYYYDYDSATFKKYLIGINEIEENGPGHERKFNYKIDTHGRITSVEISQDGKTEMTITRTYR
ncbi:MAG: hypothetical protein J5565_07380 [Muribaculaceae bacterium]|nr:hypothetical protein [Muribaculaceae bacterium]